MGEETEKYRIRRVGNLYNIQIKQQKAKNFFDRKNVEYEFVNLGKMVFIDLDTAKEFLDALRTNDNNIIEYYY